MLEGATPDGATSVNITSSLVQYESNQAAIIAGYGTTDDLFGTGKLRASDARLTSVDSGAKLLRINGEGSSNTRKGDSGHRQDTH